MKKKVSYYPQNCNLGPNQTALIYPALVYLFSELNLSHCFHYFDHTNFYPFFSETKRRYGSMGKSRHDDAHTKNFHENTSCVFIVHCLHVGGVNSRLKYQNMLCVNYAA